jgi:RHS repeat-associated protein
LTQLERKKIESMKRLLFITLLLPFLSVFSFGQGNVPNGATIPASAVPTPVSTYFYPERSPFYLRSIQSRVPIQDTSKLTYATSVDSALISTRYSDPLGRPYEVVVKQASPLKVDYVSMSVYDEFSRQSIQYLPFVAQSNNTNDGLFKFEALPDDSLFYKSQVPNEQIYYGKTVYDASPLQRVVKAMAPGNSWTGASVGISNAWRANNIADSVHQWTIPISTENDVASTTTMYLPGSLQVQQTTDERGVKMLVYVDELGRKVMTKTQAVPSPGTAHVGWLCTYYVYDEMNHLRVVLPPKAVAALNTSAINWSLTADSTISTNLCYTYFYDSRGRGTMKRIPGKGKGYVVYDIADRPVFSQDSLLRASNQWTGLLYDGQSRPTITGILNYTATWSQLQQLVTTQTGNATTATINTDSLTTTNLTLSSNPTTGDYRASSSISLAAGFGVSSGSSFSATIASGAAAMNSLVMAGSPLPAGAAFNILTVSYYDDYAWLSDVNITTLGSSLAADNINGANFNLSYNTAPEYSQPLVSSLRTRGSVTGTKRAVINSSNYLFSVVIYDDHNRPIQTKQTNYSGGTDVATTQYNFSGNILRAHVAHQKGGANAQNHMVLTKFSYDHMGRVLSISKGLDNAALKTVSQGTYNELGQINHKTIGNSIETQNYAYNMRGWLLGINSDYVGTSGSNSNYFGETLAYDYGFTNSQLNGNIAGVIWKAGGDGVARAYGYSYDSANRLTGANFTQLNSGSSSWTKDQVDYTVTGLTYDAGGNILGMIQKGLVDGRPTTIDSLTYQYYTNSNQLQKVSDGSSVTCPLGDFKDSTNTGSDYAYDGNGNATIDYNRHLVTSAGGNGAVYNFLNKPDSLVLNGKAGIHYTYDAVGMRLAKQVNDYTTGHLVRKTWQYISGFVYCNDTLQYVLSEESQIRNARKVNSSTGAIYYAFEYDYFIKDHQGNVRTILTEGSDTATYSATMESKDSVVVAATFSNVYSPSYTVTAKPTAFDSDTSNHNVALLNPVTGASVGPSIVLKVMRGDQVQISTYSFYNSPVQSPQSGINLLSNIVNVLGNSVIGVNGHLAAGDLTGVNNALTPNVTQFLNNGRSYDSTRPKAYLNWILFDDQFNYVAGNSGVTQVISGSTKQALAAPTQNIGKNGYLYVYVSNESQQNVYFDNLTVRQMTGPLQQEQSYYPFGLPMAGISDKALLKINTPFKANEGTELEEDYGLQYYNTLFRKYDPQIGRFNGIDALSESAAGNSPYHFAGNNPVLGSDPTGLLTDYHYLLYGSLGPHLQGGGGVSDVDETFNELDGFDAETGIGVDPNDGNGLFGGPLSADKLWANQMTIQFSKITPHISAMFPEAPFLLWPGFGGSSTGTDKFGNTILKAGHYVTLDDDMINFLPSEWRSKVTLHQLIVKLGRGTGGFSGGMGGPGFGFIGNFNIQFPNLDVEHKIITTQKSMEWFNYGLVKATRFGGGTEEIGEGLFTEFQTLDNLHLASQGYGVHYGDYNASLNYDIDNIGFFVDIGLGKWDVTVGGSIRSGISLGHSYTNDDGSMGGVNVSMPFLPTLGPVGNPVPVPIIIP